MGSAVAAAVLVAAILQTPASLTGTIRAADGTPIAGATVTIHQTDRILTAASDRTGQFAFADVTLPAVVEVAAPGFGAQSRLVDAPPADFTLTPASVRESVVVNASSSAVQASVWRSGETGQTSLSRDDLEKVPAVTPDESLRVIPGFSLFRRSTARASNPTTHGVTMRGLSASGSSRGLVLLDGLPLNEAFGSWVTWTRVPPAAIAEVDVDRGAQSDVFGSDALGGAIDLQSRTAVQPGLFSVAGEGGSQGLGSSDLAAGLRRGRWAAFGAVGWFTNNGEIPVEPASRGSVDRPASADWTNALGRLDGYLDWGVLRVTALAGSEERGNGTAQQWNRMHGGTFAAAFTTDRVGSAIITARVSTGPNHFDQSFTTVAAGRNSETLTSIQGVDTTSTRALVEIGHGLPFGMGFLVGRVGINRSASDFEVATPAAITTRALRDDSEAVSLQAGFTPAAGVTFGAGVRHEWRAAPESANSREGATVGHVSGAWNLINYHTTIRGSFGTSHRWPTLNELVRDFRVGNVLTTANPSLLPERAQSGDVAVTYDRGTWSASATGFWTVVEDAIANVTLSSTPALITRQRRNAGEAHASGAELEGEVRPMKQLRIRASAVIMDARFRESLEPALEGNRLPQVPNATIGVGADATLPWQIAASVFVRSTGDQYDDDRNQFLLADATQVDLRVAGRFGPGGRLGWHFVMENAADARIEVGRTPLVTLAPGRVIRAGFSFKY